MKPLTIEELRALPAGDWIWFVCLTDYFMLKRQAFYFEKEGNDDDSNGIYGDSRHLVGFLPFDCYGKDWVAYKNKEESEEVIIRFAEQKGAIKC